MRRSSCQPRIVRVVGLGSLGVPGGSLAAWVRARSAAQTRRFEVDGPVRAGRLGKENAELRLDRAVPRQPRPPILPARRSGDPLRCSFRDHQATYPVKRLREPAGCSRSGLHRWRDRPLSPPDRADGEPGRDPQHPSRVTADLRHPFVFMTRLRRQDRAAQPQAGGSDHGRTRPVTSSSRRPVDRRGGDPVVRADPNTPTTTGRTRRDPRVTGLSGR